MYPTTRHTLTPPSRYHPYAYTKHIPLQGTYHNDYTLHDEDNTWNEKDYPEELESTFYDSDDEDTFPEKQVKPDVCRDFIKKLFEEKTFQQVEDDTDEEYDERYPDLNAEETDSDSE